MGEKKLMKVMLFGEDDNQKAVINKQVGMGLMNSRGFVQSMYAGKCLHK